MVYVQYPDGRRFTFFSTAIGLVRIPFKSELHDYLLELVKAQRK